MPLIILQRGRFIGTEMVAVPLAPLHELDVRQVRGEWLERSHQIVQHRHVQAAFGGKIGVRQICSIEDMGDVL